MSKRQGAMFYVVTIGLIVALAFALWKIYHWRLNAAVVAATDRGRGADVLALVERGGDINITDARGATPLHTFAGRAQTDIVQRLLALGADPNKADYNGVTPLMSASSRGRVDIVHLLIQYGADVNAKSEPGGSTALRCATLMGHTDMVKVLLDAGAQVNARTRVDKFTETPLIVAARLGYTSSVRLLLERGADVNAKDGKGKTALMWAQEKGHTDIVRLLKLAGARR